MTEYTTDDLGVIIDTGYLTPGKLKWETADNTNKVTITDGKITAGSETGYTEIVCYYDDDPHNPKIPIFTMLVNVVTN